MAFEAFSTPWVEAWGRTLNESDAYRRAAAEWEGSVALLLDGENEGPARAVLLDLWHGACRGARTAAPDALEEARYVFRGSRAAWKHILTEGGSPVLALLGGRIQLARGELSALLPFAGAARELLSLAATVPTAFSEG